ncbi:MAG: hypothetical protein ACJZ40_01715 [Candidatus Poseidoniaceae archaeon]
MAVHGQNKLISLLQAPHASDERVVRQAAQHLVKLSRRQRLPIPADARHLFCRKCRAPHRFGINARARVKHGQRIITCLECSHVRRFGGGPKSHRSRLK